MGVGRRPEPPGCHFLELSFPLVIQRGCFFRSTQHLHRRRRVMKHRGCKLVVSAVLALAVLCFSPPAFGADSASLASIGPSVGSSQGTGGQLADFFNLPTKFYYGGRWYSISGGDDFSRADCGTVNGIPGALYREPFFRVVIRLTSGWVSPIVQGTMLSPIETFSEARARLGLNP